MPPIYFHKEASGPPGAAMCRSAIAQLATTLWGAANAMRPPLPGRKGAHKLADSLCRFQTTASQHKHGRLTGLNDAAF